MDKGTTTSGEHLEDRLGFCPTHVKRATSRGDDWLLPGDPGRVCNGRVEVSHRAWRIGCRTPFITLTEDKTMFHASTSKADGKAERIVPTSCSIVIRLATELGCQHHQG